MDKTYNTSLLNNKTKIAIIIKLPSRQRNKILRYVLSGCVNAQLLIIFL